MNTVIFMGRLTKAPEIRYTNDKMAIASFSLAVDRRFKKGEADFFNCKAFGKAAEFAEKYLTKGTKIVAQGRAQTYSYQNKEGKKISGVEFVLDDIEFAESKGKEAKTEEKPASDDFVQIPEGVADEELPFV